jgi:uncharacterized protein (TIRG00374 family)
MRWLMRLPRLARSVGLFRTSDDTDAPKDLRSNLGRRIFSLPTLLSLGVAGAFIFFIASGIDLDWSDTLQNVSEMKAWPYVIALVLYYSSFLFRGYRWKILARSAAKKTDPEGTTISLPSILRFSQLIIMGWFVNTIAWLRLGDAYRAWAFSDDSKGGFSWGLGTLLAERALDMATVALLLVISVLAATATTDNAALQYLLIAAAGMATGLVGLLAAMRLFGMRLAVLLPGKLQRIYRGVHQGTLGSIELRQLPLLTLLSVIGWGLEAGRLYFVIDALGLTLSLPMVMIVALGHALLSTVPTPGGIGAVETGMTGLLILSMPKSDAASVAVLDRSITLLSVMVFGGAIFLLNGIVQGRQARKRATL